MMSFSSNKKQQQHMLQQHQTYSLENSAALRDNINDNFNTNDLQNTVQKGFVPEIKQSWLDTLKGLSVAAVVCLIIFPITIITIGAIHRDNCVAEPNIPLFLIVFGAAILVNLVLYAIAGATFLALLKRLVSFSFGNGAMAVIASILGLLVGAFVLGWWIAGTIWWIKLTTGVHPQFNNPASYTYCHPVVYWTALVAIIIGLVGGIVQLCIAVGGCAGAAGTLNTNSHPNTNPRGGR